MVNADFYVNLQMLILGIPFCYHFIKSYGFLQKKLSRSHISNNFEGLVLFVYTIINMLINCFKTTHILFVFPQKHNDGCGFVPKTFNLLPTTLLQQPLQTATLNRFPNHNLDRARYLNEHLQQQLQVNFPYLNSYGSKYNKMKDTQGKLAFKLLMWQFLCKFEIELFLQQQNHVNVCNGALHQHQRPCCSGDDEDQSTLTHQSNTSTNNCNSSHLNQQQDDGATINNCNANSRLLATSTLPRMNTNRWANKLSWQSFQRNIIKPLPLF